MFYFEKRQNTDSGYPLSADLLKILLSAMPASGIIAYLKELINV
jgi:hypothetical protein